MDSLYLLIPLSVVLILGIGGLLAWSVMSGQFDDIEQEGGRILQDEDKDPPQGANLDEKSRQPSR